MKRFNPFGRRNKKAGKQVLKIIHKGVPLRPLFPRVEHFLKIYYRRLV
jgi:hypothetical protein